jgi:hypothetical protein
MTFVPPSLPASVHTKTKGDIAEAYITARLLEKGMTVLRPVGDNARYDLVIEAGGAFARVQRKTGCYDPRATNVLRFPACSSATHTNRGKRSYRGEADLFAVWFPPLRTVYLVPVSHVGVSAATLRLAPARNGQSKRIRLASQYGL